MSLEKNKCGKTSKGELSVMAAKFYYGGQAVMEGVMMRGRKSVAVAIRRSDSSIYLHEEALNPRLYHNRVFRLPFLRGILLLWEMLVLGTRMMTLSANIATGAMNPESPAPELRVARTNGSDNANALQDDLESPPQIGGVALIVTLI